MRLGKYQILDRLGEGGMGVVYRALDTQLGRTVALKLLPEDLQADARRRERFVREARAAAALHHPNVATLFELGEIPQDASHPSRLFLAMEYIEGRDLRQALTDGDVTREQAIDIGIQLAKGLAEAHAHGIVHRDLKPGNIVLTHDGQAKILDFGLAKSLAPVVDEQAAARDQLTREGVAVGTPPYMAPEQARGGEIDARADLFSLGVILYELLAGRRPFSANSFIDYVLEVERTGPKPLLEVVPDLDPRFAAVVERLLQKHPADRFANASEVAQALRRAAHSSSRGEASTLVEPYHNGEAATNPISATRAVPRTLLIAAVTLLVAALLGALVLLRGSGENDRLRLAVAPFENLTGDTSLDFAARGFGLALASELSALDELSVVSPNVAAAYSEPGRYRDLAADYDVVRLLAGRLQREGQRVLVGVDLIDTRDGSLKWSQIFEGRPEELIRLHREIAQGVGSNFGAPLSRQSRDRLEREPTRSGEAYENQLRGLQFLESGEGVNDYEVAVRYFDRAIAADPRYADAYAGRAAACGELYQAREDVRALTCTIEAGETAREIDPGNRRAMLALASGYRAAGRVAEAASLVTELGEVDPDQTETPSSSTHAQADLLLERAHDLDAAGQRESAHTIYVQATEVAPDLWRAWANLGIHEIRTGVHAAGRQHLERARALAPLKEDILGFLIAAMLMTGDYQEAIRLAEEFEKPITMRILASNIGYAYYLTNDAEQAERYFELATRLDPLSASQRGNLGDALLRQGRVREAQTQYEAALALVEERLEAYPSLPGAQEGRVLYLAKLGRCDQAAEADAQRSPAAAPDGIVLTHLAKAFALCDDERKAFDYLERALSLGASARLLQGDDEFDELRPTPRFKELLQSANRPADQY